MKVRTGIKIGDDKPELNWMDRRGLTRRTLGGALLGGLASIGVGIAEKARGEAITTTAEPDGPDHLPRRRVKVLDTEISYVDTGVGLSLIHI